MGAANAVTTVDMKPFIDTTLARLDGYLDNIAAAASNKRSTLQQLIDANATLTASVASFTAAYTLLAEGVGKQPTPAVPTATSTGGRKKKQHTPLDPNCYYWTHGYCVGVGHNGATCTNKKDGHKDLATRANIMGGSTMNKEET